MTNHLALSKPRIDTNLHEKIVEMDINKDGFKEYRRQEIKRGTNLVLTTIWDGKSVTRAYPVGNYVFIEHDADGDGLFEQISILKDNDVYDAYLRSPNGQVNPLPNDSLLDLQKNNAEAKDIMTNLVDAVTNRNSHKVQQVLESIRNRDRKTQSESVVSNNPSEKGISPAKQ